MDMMLGWLSDRDRKVFRLSYGLVDGKIYKQEEIARIVALVEVVFRWFLLEIWEEWKNGYYSKKMGIFYVEKND